MTTWKEFSEEIEEMTERLEKIEERAEDLVEAKKQQGEMVRKLREQIVESDEVKAKDLEYEVSKRRNQSVSEREIARIRKRASLEDDGGIDLDG